MQINVFLSYLKAWLKVLLFTFLSKFMIKHNINDLDIICPFVSYLFITKSDIFVKEEGEVRDQVEGTAPFRTHLSDMGLWLWAHFGLISLI